ncbi:MAG: hypothetical protein LBS74_06305 [Oscillospiraceae bacterium]|jgi:hypothetical protein|nr:hypothetical protein [Oscillospiraceae bacterium]
MKKFLAIILAVALSATLLASCTPDKEKDVSKEVKPSQITVRSTFTPNDWMTAIFTLSAEDSKVDYVNVADTGDESYKQAVTTEFLGRKYRRLYPKRII